MNSDDTREVIREAERAVYLARWRLREETALRSLASTRGVACAPLMPGSDVIQVVAYDGEHLGHVRLDGPRGRGERWVAVRTKQAHPVGSYPSPQAAARALARAADKTPKSCRGHSPPGGIRPAAGTLSPSASTPSLGGAPAPGSGSAALRWHR